MTSFAFLMLIIGFPAILISVAGVVRIARGIQIPASTDLIALLITVDILTLCTPDEIDRYATILGQHNDLTTINILFLIVGMVIWGACLYDIEPKIDGWYKSNVRIPSNFPFCRFALAWAGYIGLFALHYGVFTGKISI
jgi:hypothetical protein